VSELRIIGLSTPVPVSAETNLVTTFLAAVADHGLTLEVGDLVIVTSKVVSKAEGRVVACGPSDDDKLKLVEQESVRVLRRRGPLRITETTHGFINANAGIDLSNTDEGTAVLLPIDPDRSARRFRGDLARATGLSLAVIITDTFGRTWRNGVTDVALGSAGIIPVLDLRGTRDANGRVLEATEVAIVDEIAGAANLVLGKADGAPFAIVRGLRSEFFGEGSVRENVVRPAHGDLFR